MSVLVTTVHLLYTFITDLSINSKLPSYMKYMRTHLGSTFYTLQILFNIIPLRSVMTTDTKTH